MDKLVGKPVDKLEEAKKPAEKPISLRPLKFEEAVRGLLQVKPAATKSASRNRKSGASS